MSGPKNWDLITFHYLMQSTLFSHVNCLGVILLKHGVIFPPRALFNFGDKNYMSYIKKQRENLLALLVEMLRFATIQSIVTAIPWGIYLSDGIYPSWSRFVLTIQHPKPQKECHFSSAQEAYIPEGHQI
jgi:hypothetical protein